MAMMNVRARYRDADKNVQPLNMVRFTRAGAVVGGYTMFEVARRLVDNENARLWDRTHVDISWLVFKSAANQPVAWQLVHLALMREMHSTCRFCARPRKACSA